MWHVISIYRRNGFERFILLTGYLGEMIEEYVASGLASEDIDCVALDTGLDTPTGGRVLRAAELIGDGTFCLTYVDGLADIDLESLLAFHRSHGALATMTTVRPDLPWGVAKIGEASRIDAFVEKPRVDEWINGGFFCLEAGALGFLGEADVLEEAPLRALASEGQLMAFRHEGFWDCVDTYKDLVVVNDLWQQGRAAWLPSS